MSLPLPAGLLELIGYHGTARAVAFYATTQGLRITDGDTEIGGNGFDVGVFLYHPAVTDAAGAAGLTTTMPGYWWVADTDARLVRLMPEPSAAAVLRARNTRADNVIDLRVARSRRATRHHALYGRALHARHEERPGDLFDAITTELNAVAEPAQAHAAEA